MRHAAILVLLLSLPGSTNAAVLSLYSPFDYTHNGHNGNGGYHRRDVSQPPSVAGEPLMGCGRGRVRDIATHQCRGPADLR